MQIQNFLEDNENLKKHLHKFLTCPELFSMLSDAEKDAIGAENPGEYHERWVEALTELGRVCANELEKNSREVDENPVTWDGAALQYPSGLQRNLEVLSELGVAPFGIDPDYGGLGATYVVEMAALEMLNRSCPSTTLNCTWYSSIAHVLQKFGSKELAEKFIPQLASGEMSGNMALTEPDAGSDLSNLKTYAVEQDDGTWNLFGCKRFITNGTSGLSLVLAKTRQGAEGLENLSLFACPRIVDGQENIKVEKLEHKMGLNGSATAELVYQNSKAWIIGKPNEGFRYMLQLMNDSRIGVTFQAIGNMQATYNMAAEYASQRQAWGKPLNKHELISSLLMDMEVNIRAARSLGYKAAYHRSLIVALEKKLKAGVPENERESLERKLKSLENTLRAWTPLLKYWVSEQSVTQARQALQVFGGYGFTKEYSAERWVRESLIYPIYEGTSQIQALMCLKDALKGVVRRPRKFIEQGLSLRVRQVTEKDALKKKGLKIQQISHGAVISLLFRLLKRNVQSKIGREIDLAKVIKLLSPDLVKFENLRPALLAAQHLCELKSLEALSNSLLEDLDSSGESRWVAQRFLYNAVPRAEYLKMMIEERDEVVEELLDRDDDHNQPEPQPTGTED